MSKITIINKTPHAVYLLDEDDTSKIIRAFPKSRGMARVVEHTQEAGTIDGIPISSTTWGDVKDLPEEIPGVFYIVSQLVKNKLPDRNDLLTVRKIVREKDGSIRGALRLDIG